MSGSDFFFFGAITLVAIVMNVALYLAEKQDPEEDSSDHPDTNPHTSN